MQHRPVAVHARQIASTWQVLPGFVHLPIRRQHRLELGQYRALSSTSCTGYQRTMSGQHPLKCQALPEKHEEEEGALDGAREALNRWFWGELTLEQRIYTIVAVMALLFLLPRLFVLFVIGLERAFVGSLLAAEEVVVQLIFRLASLGLTIWLGFLALVGIYLFIGPWKDKQQDEGKTSGVASDGLNSFSKEVAKK